MSNCDNIVVDGEKCIGCGTCVAFCPDCFELKDGISVVKSDCEKCSCDVQEAIDACPVGAISKN